MRGVRKLLCVTMVLVMAVGVLAVLTPADTQAAPSGPCSKCPEVKLIGSELCFLIGCRGKNCFYNCEIIE